MKEPSIPKTPREFLETLKDLQHLDSSDWCEVRYAETQKLYNSTPGFIDLEMNEEIRAYDSLRHLAHADKTFAALSFAKLYKLLSEVFYSGRVVPICLTRVLTKKLTSYF